MSRAGQTRKVNPAAQTRPQESARPPREPLTRTPVRVWVSWLVPLLIALVTVAAFLPTLQNGFVNWDDDKNLLDNPHYRGLGWPHLRWMWTTFHMGQYIPLTWMTLGLDYLLWGLQPLGYHLSSLLLHAANAVVFYFVALRILGRALPGPGAPDRLRLALSAAFAALFFALHPLRVESVAWATERRDVLSGLFYLSTLLVYLRAHERGEHGPGWHWRAVGLFACALLSKSMAVNLPVVLLILDVYPLRRLGGPTGWWGAPARQVYLEKIPFILLAGAASALAFLALARVHNMASLNELTALGRLAISAYGLSFYLGKTVAPFDLSPLYALPIDVNPSAPPFLLSDGVVLAITALAWNLRRRVPGLPAAWLAYAVTLLPVLGVFQNGPQVAADRYTYLAGLGWAIWAGAGLVSSWRPRAFLPPGLAAGVLLGLGVLSWTQARVWHDSQRLWTHALGIDPNSPVAENNLGEALARQGKPAAAIEHYRQALKARPDYADAHYNWGAALARQGRLAAAIEHYREALTIRPNYAEALNNWGNALTQQGRPAEAIEHYREALTIRPNYAEAFNNWGNALTQQGRPAEAIEHYRQALAVWPDFAEAHYNWGAALAQQGRPAEAIEHYRAALQITPDYAEAHYNWGVLLAQQGRPAEAIERYRQALALRPDFADAHYNWGNALLKQAKPAEAIESYRRALMLKPDFAEAHYNWGAALARQGKHVEAMEHFQRARSLRANTTSNP
jgi:tetratricopeptide (TPR) repeat protein